MLVGCAHVAWMGNVHLGFVDRELHDVAWQ
jgi:hypothetical protein